MDTSTINFYKGNHKYEVSADELATEIAQCLQIENLNFLIGAGCSSYRDDTRMQPKTFFRIIWKP